MHLPYRVAMATRYLETVLDLRWTYAGVDTNLYGNGGEDCAYFIPLWQKICETAIFTLLALYEIRYAYSRLSLPEKIPDTELKGDRTGRKVMLMIMCLTFGIEIGFKCATRQLIWILNPCHVITMVQIFLLVAPPRRYTTAVFRVSMHCLSGATVAILFPVVHTRQFPFEAETYFIQHALMLVIPYYLLRLGGAYTPEPLNDWSWDILSCGILFLYHFLFLQPVGMLIHINLNNMQCPAPSDPFFGLWYRTAAVFHQHIVVLLHGKCYTWVSQLFLPRRVQLSIGNSRADNGNGSVVVGESQSSRVVRENGRIYGEVENSSESNDNGRVSNGKGRIGNGIGLVDSGNIRVKQETTLNQNKLSKESEADGHLSGRSRGNTTKTSVPPRNYENNESNVIDERYIKNRDDHNTFISQDQTKSAGSENETEENKNIIFTKPGQHKNSTLEAIRNRKENHKNSNLQSQDTSRNDQLKNSSLSNGHAKQI